ncbi:MAG: formate dehydrogenase accessory sulfurtransferase FdhD [Burkholderiaceae bacterium]|nr:formate dehydrogenase accessory sulfurtransferase FdhD [Burkholderiaceae bacterium]
MSEFPSIPIGVLRYRAGLSTAESDHVAVECPIALEYNGISHAVMLASPSDVADFALGFSLSEGIIARPQDLFDLEVRPAEKGLVVALTIATQQFERLKTRRRSLTGRTGCGICGLEALEQLAMLPAPVSGKQTFSRMAIVKAVAGLIQQQPLQVQTGATHAAAWLNRSGDLRIVREDVGRHNALDKLIGAVVKSGLSFSEGALLMTSRASVEIVQKAATMGIGHIAAVSAPTSMAVGLARDCGVTLVGFLRGQDHVVYAHEVDLAQ